MPAAAAWAKVFALPFPFPDTSTHSSAWMRGALEGAGVFCLGSCWGFGGCCTSCGYSIVVWYVCSPKYCRASKFILPRSAVCCIGGAYPCGYGWAVGLGCAGAGAGAFCWRPASCCSSVTPTLIVLDLSAKKLTVLVVEACFSARSMIWVCVIGVDTIV